MRKAIKVLIKRKITGPEDIRAFVRGKKIKGYDTSNPEELSVLTNSLFGAIIKKRGELVDGDIFEFEGKYFNINPFILDGVINYSPKEVSKPEEIQQEEIHQEDEDMNNNVEETNAANEPTDGLLKEENKIQEESMMSSIKTKVEKIKELLYLLEEDELLEVNEAVQMHLRNIELTSTNSEVVALDTTGANPEAAVPVEFYTDEEREAQMKENGFYQPKEGKHKCQTVQDDILAVKQAIRGKYIEDRPTGRYTGEYDESNRHNTGGRPTGRYNGDYQGQETYKRNDVANPQVTDRPTGRYTGDYEGSSRRGPRGRYAGDYTGGHTYENHHEGRGRNGNRGGRRRTSILSSDSTGLRDYLKLLGRR